MTTDDVDLPSLANVLAERLAEARARLSEVEAERDATSNMLSEQRRLADVAQIEVRDLHVEREAWRPVVEAAIAWRQALGSSRELMVFGTIVGKQSRAMVAAVDALPTRNVDFTTPGVTDGD